MASVTVRDDGIDLDSPVLVEGLPGVGLVGKIATDHVVETFEMDYYASVDCEGLPHVAVYQEGDQAVRPPVRLYADEDRNLLALQSDVPVSNNTAPGFATCLTGWIEDNDVTPLYLSGFPTDKGPEVPDLYGIATGDGSDLLDGADVGTPDENGVVSGPTGALLHRAAERGITSVGLIVESDPRFPDPEAARVIIDEGLSPIVDADVNVDALVEKAEEIRSQKEELAQRMQQADDDESSQAQPLRMYQ